jgi:3-phosphoshikimate 1-carboxyvinyltransferase
MNAIISKSTIAGGIGIVPSKSYTIRALVCAVLANGSSRVSNPLIAEDTIAAVGSLCGIGAGITFEKYSWLVRGGRLKPPDCELFCGESAATLRFLSAVCSLIKGESRLTFGPSLAKRPVVPLLQALESLGAITQRKDNTIIIEGGGVKGGTVKLAGDISSQFISALLIAAPLMDKGLTIRLSSAPVSVPYLKMTLEILEYFDIDVETSADLKNYKIAPQSYCAKDIVIEGDWSAASYPLALGASGGRASVSGLNIRSFQADRIMLELLQQMGAIVEISSKNVTVSTGKLKAIETDLTDSIDLLPTLAALAALAEGQSVFKGIAKARLKESNRVLAMKDGLTRMGIEISEEEDRLLITGGKPIGTAIDSYKDHRIAMAFSIIGAAVGNTVITDAECVAKTYPTFWQDFKALGGKVTTNE